MKTWLRRFAYLAVLLIWLIVMSFPILAFALAIRGQVQFGSDTRRQVRLFLVQEEEFQGVGIQWTRPSGEQSQCTETSLNYILWEGDSQNQNTRYCVCYVPGTNQPETTGPCPGKN